MTRADHISVEVSGFDCEPLDLELVCVFMCLNFFMGCAVKKILRVASCFFSNLYCYNIVCMDLVGYICFKIRIRLQTTHCRDLYSILLYTVACSVLRLCE